MHPSVCLSVSWRQEGKTEGFECHGSRSERKRGVGGDRKCRGKLRQENEREVVYFVLLGDSAVASLQFTCAGLDFLKLLHRRPSCQS